MGEIWNISFKTLHDGQFSLSTQLMERNLPLTNTTQESLTIRSTNWWLIWVFTLTDGVKFLQCFFFFFFCGTKNNLQNSHTPNPPPPQKKKKILCYKIGSFLQAKPYLLTGKMTQAYIQMRVWCTHCFCEEMDHHIFLSSSQ